MIITGNQNEVEIIETIVSNGRTVKVGDNVEIDTDQVSNDVASEWEKFKPFVVVKIVQDERENFLYLSMQKCVKCDKCMPVRVRACMFK